MSSMKKYYELQRGDKALHGGKILTFQRPDGSYAKWLDEDGNLITCQADGYELNDEWIYIPCFWL